MAAVGTIKRGKASVFGGPSDASDSGHTASGGTTATPGIAVYDRSTLGGFWLLRAPNGKVKLVKQTDIGPAPWTGRIWDITYSATKYFGYTEGGFPTDEGTWTGMYLGKNPTAAQRYAAGAGGAHTEFASFNPLDIIPWRKGIPGVPDPLDFGLNPPSLDKVNPLDPGSLGNLIQLPGEILDFFKKILNIFYPEFWLRVGKVVLGVIFLIFAINILSKAMFGVDLFGTAKKAAAKTAEVGAEVAILK